jgi:hypothetical protein
MAEITALQAKELSKQDLLNIPGVSGVGVSSGSAPRINIYVVEKTPELEAKIPTSIEGVETRIIETGQITAFQLLETEELATYETSRTQKSRPFFPGMSVANIGATAGTYGYLVRDNVTGRLGILSNAHVLTSDPSKSTMEDYRVTQPGPYDGGTNRDVVGSTVRWIPLNPFGINSVDCALALLDNEADVSSDIIGIGPVVGIEEPKQGMGIVKSGRTTGVTEGTILDINADVKVGYKGFTAQFENQVICTSMAEPGDSGSLCVNKANRNAVALLFAGSPTITIVTPISRVMGSLNVSLAGATSISGVSQAGGWIMLPLVIGGLYMLYKGGVKL